MLIVDDLRARKTASKLGLRIMGTVGVLLAAAEKKILRPEELKTCCDLLQKSGFRLSRQLVVWVEKWKSSRS